MSIKINELSQNQKLNTNKITEIADFLYNNLDKYRDNLSDIKKCLKDNSEQKYGIVLVAEENQKIVGVAVANQTGMNGYVPSYLLVYIAVSASTRGKGIGRKIIEEVIKKTKGDIALHVDFTNPAKNLYERAGFKPKYIEMRYQKQ